LYAAFSALPDQLIKKKKKKLTILMQEKKRKEKIKNKKIENHIFQKSKIIYIVYRVLQKQVARQRHKDVPLRSVPPEMTKKKKKKMRDDVLVVRFFESGKRKIKIKLKN
jgi:hypothetical protein